MIIPVPNEYVSVAQLDRASDYGSEGRVFESCHSQKKTANHKVCGFLWFIEKAEEFEKHSSDFARLIYLLRKSFS